MSLYMLDVNKQRDQFIKVIDYLKSCGETQKTIGAKIGQDNVFLSHLRSGEIKNISDEVLDNLHEEYNINPNFIRYGSACMLDIPQLKYDNFECFVDKWDLVDHEEKSYLHFSMDENFYNFLLKVYELKEKTSNIDDNDVFLKAFEALKTSYSTNAISKEYVLIPADRVTEIEDFNKRRRKVVNEALDLLNL